MSHLSYKRCKSMNSPYCSRAVHITVRSIRGNNEGGDSVWGQIRAVSFDGSSGEDSAGWAIYKNVVVNRGSGACEL